VAALISRATGDRASRIVDSVADLIDDVD